ncbi:DUF6560 family protein [Acholeplasma oculi]|nr:DUF6560 family protein [Acholeplasma oculi]
MYLSLTIVPLMVGIVTPLVFGLLRKSNLKKEVKMNKQDFIMCYSLTWAWVSLFTSIGLILILVLLNIFDEVRLGVNILVIPFIVLFLFGVYAFIREKIVVKEDTITVTPIFGKTRSYTFFEIKKLQEVTWSNGTTSYKVCKDKKLFSVSNSVPGYNLFMERIREMNIKIESALDQTQNKKSKNKNRL